MLSSNAVPADGITPTGRHRRADAGLSLIEILVALGIVVVVMVSGGNAYGRILTAQRSAEGTDQAQTLASSTIAEVQQMTYPLIGFATTGNGYQAKRGAEDTVTLGAVSPGMPPPLQAVTLGRTFTVRTDITWAAAPASGGIAATTTTARAYKRIHVTVTWALGAATKTVDSETLRSAGATDSPVSVGVPPGGSDCAYSLTNPVCSAFVTDGTIMNIPVGSAPAVANQVLDFRVTLSIPANFVVAGVFTGSVTTAVSMSQLSGGSLVWDGTLPVNSAVPVGLNPVTFSIVGTNNVVYNQTVSARWSYPDINPVTIAWSGGGASWPPPASSFFDFASPDPTQFRGDETVSRIQSLCVNASGALFHDVALMFDVTGVKDTGANYEPTVTYEGANDSAPPVSATFIDRTTVSVAAAGSFRWYVLFPAGTVFDIGNSQINIGMTRQDGTRAFLSVQAAVESQSTAGACV